MQRPERDELIRAVRGGEAVSTVAARLGVPKATAYQWMRRAAAKASPTPGPAPTFVEVVAERATQSAIQIRIGAAEIEVCAGFDARLLRRVVEALGGES